MKTIREMFMKIKTVVTALPILFLTGCTQNIKEISSVGIIGGADGPTAVFVSGKFNWKHILAALCVVIALVAAIVLLVKKFIKKN